VRGCVCHVAAHVHAGALWGNIEGLQMQVAQLDKRLREASKAREQRLRRAPIELRAIMAYEMQVCIRSGLCPARVDSAPRPLRAP
jgi:hypothetical protein